MKLSSATFLALFAALSTAESCSYKSDDYGTLKGTCMKPSTCNTLGGYLKKDLCSGGSDNVCCIQKSCKAPKSITGFCTTIKNCDSIGFAKRVKNKCPGGDDVQCCYYDL
ncbi:hypothetical protein B0T18DRAFT_410227 [Schizothecium vesticola]|uniref:Uncharacterized protein n=1 Tax=Schizothecium vesticola TaxID=314040 RepID=A0AA40EUP0_9PEZI|nr:hypothetical protein B0T18DRAFT_410227 [Schizothecium vesticola]